jgi:hypothetical protein
MLQIGQISLDWISFGIGVVAGCLLWLIIWGFRKIIHGMRSSLRETNKVISSKKQQGFKEAYLQSLLNKALRQHLAFQLFSLDEILIEPRVCVPPPIVDPNHPPLSERVTDRWIPYLPEQPEFISQYSIAGISVADALQNGGNYFLFGRPGTGKSVALTDLALRCCRQDATLGTLGKLLPLFLHITEVDYSQIDGDPLKEVAAAILFLFPHKVHKELTNLLHSFFEPGSVLLILDGLDELSNTEIEKAAVFLEKLLKQKPQMRIVTTAFGKGFESLVGIGFEPLVLAGWSPLQVSQLFTKWKLNWNRSDASAGSHTEGGEIDDRILLQWLLSEKQMATPIEWTLRIWSFLANDAHSTLPSDLISDYFERLRPNCKVKDIESFAVKLIDGNESALQTGEVHKWLPGDVVSDLVGKGFLDQYRSELIKFPCPIIAGYFARASIQPVSPTSVWEALNWSLKFAQYSFQEEVDMGEKIISAIDIEADAPAYTSLLAANRWFVGDSIDSRTRDFILKTLYGLIRKEELPFSTRLSLLAGCVLHASPAVDALLKQLIRSGSPMVKEATAIAVGSIRGEKFIPDLLELLSDPVLDVRGAGLLALSQFEKATATNQIIEALLSGDESEKLLAAEALTNNGIVGHEILKQSAKSKDFMVRRSAVVAIGHINAEWVKEFLTQVSVEDDQWIVRNAAANALEAIQSPGLQAPRPLTKASETEWLIQCAGNRGVGIPAGKLPVSLLLDILKTGSPEEQLGALDYLKRSREKSVIQTLQTITRDGSSPIREKALYCLWYMMRAGAAVRSLN